MSQAIVTVNIGRNLDDRPMSDQQWATFQELVSVLLAETVGKVSYSLTGDCESHWQGEVEQSASFNVVDAQVSADDAARFRNPVQYLRIGLANLARRYGQEAISLTVGHVELVAPSHQADALADVSTSNGPDYVDANREYADQRGHDVAWMTANERSELTNRVTKLDNDLSTHCHHGK